MSLRIVVLLMVLVLAGGCTTMTPAECTTANWRDVGLRDGLAGESLTRLDERTTACAEAGVRADAGLYLEGRSQGLRDYCRPDNAARLGLAGKSYHGVCPPAFGQRYGAGREVYSARSALRSQEDRQHKLEDQLRRASSDDDRRRLRQDLGDLDRSMRRTRDRLRAAESALDNLR